MADLDPAMAFYRDILGFRPSDYATVPGRMFFFHTNPRHHCLALGQLGFSGLHHLMIEVVDFDNASRVVDYGQTGRVKLTTLTREFFVPGFLERDEGERERPYQRYPWDGVSGVRPFHELAATTTVGVY